MKELEEITPKNNADNLPWFITKLYEAEYILQGILADDGLSTQLGKGWADRIEKFLSKQYK